MTVPIPNLNLSAPSNATSGSGASTGGLQMSDSFFRRETPDNLAVIVGAGVLLGAVVYLVVRK